MTEIAPRRYVGSMTRRLAGWLARLHKQLSDHIFAEGDAFAIDHGWEITKTARWFGFGGRIYRDLRFDGRRPPMLAEQPYRARSRRAGRREQAVEAELVGELPGRRSPANMERDLTLGPVQRLLGGKEAPR